MWLKSLKISILFILLFLFSCNKKEKYPEMKIGYYNVVDERVYPNGDTDTLYYKMIGPQVITKDENHIYFKGNTNGIIFSKAFLLPSSATYLINSESVSFFISNLSISKTELIVYLNSDDSLGYSNKITFNYID